ncbi:hypothetical protein MA16_Dca017509 [Dendrobium catenatum]|uniref:Reverse transcriptase RNase H-like domain-containing protein n=1 Tax=Dendrobium catenatum TaxID=906689 RepID=A0A2I0X324_9ASPA|nr:hypothetical protein MA16_Dca017509 [Dendrobium catenatum]
MCNASNIIVGEVLGQKKDKKFHLIFYANKTLNSAQCNYTTTEKGLLVIITTFDKFIPLLIGTNIIIYTNHSAFKYLMTKKDTKPRLVRWIIILQEFDVEIFYRKSTENKFVEHIFRLSIEKYASNESEINENFLDV